ncbi:MAG TPA: anti-sigma regulatory factor [Steroidobacteraceae bacterium]|nr:anti-sigma regulatory factor [Steroidobacteraceae bacterium]
MPDDIHVPIKSDLDIVAARQRGRELAAGAGFSATDVTLIATAISELARNIVSYAKQGEIVLRLVENSGTRGIMIVGRDAGPGIANLGDAMRDGFSTSGGLGLGLPGIKRLMDRFDIESELGRGTTVSVCKWLR